MHRSVWLRAAAGAAVVAFAAVRGIEAKPKPLNLAACPAWGSENRGSSRAALNEVKHHLLPGDTPLVLAFSDMATLQQQADARVKSGRDAKVSVKQRVKLQGL